jgi:hypothetical protein
VRGPRRGSDEGHRGDRSAEAKGGTALYDAIYASADASPARSGRKVIILSRTARRGPERIEPGSLHTFEEALEKSLRSEAILFAIGFGKKLETELDFYGARRSRTSSTGSRWTAAGPLLPPRTPSSRAPTS